MKKRPKRKATITKSKNKVMTKSNSKLDSNKLGLILGIFAALLHAVWAITVFLGLAQSFLDWIFPIHFLNSIYSVQGFDLLTALMLIIMAFVGGYVMGLVLGIFWNLLNK